MDDKARLSKTVRELPVSEPPVDEEEAKKRYKKYSSTDPYSEIVPALLNSKDIYRYVCTTGMICPFAPEGHLQGASYEVCIGGKVVYWDEKGKRKIKKLNKKGDKFVLRPNSIAFVTLEPYFQIPHYIALRFNLKISHIYKGLLLGTGPLVDPGFHGKLSIPLHNLTANEYVFKKGDGLIQLEFTKLSGRKAWCKDKPEQSDLVEGHFIPNNFDDKPELDVEGYIEKALAANKADSVVSSIPDAMHNAQESAKSAQRWSRVIGIASVVAVLAILVTSWTLVSPLSNKIDDTYSSQIELQLESKELRIYIDSLLQRIEALEKESSDEASVEPSNSSSNVNTNSENPAQESTSTNEES